MKPVKQKQLRPKQHQCNQPGKEAQMKPSPRYQPREVNLKLAGKVALITGGDSGIGRAVAVAFAQQGADVMISYLNEHTDARETLLQIEKYDRSGVAPGPIWTPLIPATFTAEQVAKFGSGVSMKRAGEPSEVASCYVFLAIEDASYITGQSLHSNGGEIING